MTARYTTSGSLYVVYASQAGIPLNADLNDASVGTDASTAMQAVIDSVASSGRSLELIIDGPAKCKDVKLRTRQKIKGLGGSYYGSGNGTVPKAGLIQAPGGHCCLRNYNQISPYNGGSPITDFSTITDQDITIENLFINGNRGTGGINNAAANSGDPRAAADGGWICPIQLWGVRNARIDNVMVYDPPTYHFFIAYCDAGVFRNLNMCDPQNVSSNTTGRNTDGLHITGPARDILIDGLYGYTGDDFLALNADDGPYTIYNNALVYVGPITNVTARGLRLGNAFCACRVLSGNSLIDNILVADVRGKVYNFGYNGLVTGGIVNSGNGNWGRVALEDWSLNSSSTPIINLSGNATQLSVRGFRLSSLVAAGYLVSWNGSGNTIDILQIDDVTIDDVGTAVINPIRLLAGTISNLRISDLIWNRTQSVNNALVYAHGATITNMVLDHVQGNNVSNLVNYDAGTLTNLTLEGIVHRGAGGSASVAVVTQTLARMRASGCDTALLTSTATGGTVTSTKTDGVEDA